MAKGFTNSIIGGSEGLYAWEKYSIEYTPAILNKKLADLPFTFEGQTVVYNGELHALCNVINDQYYIHYKWDGTTWTSVSTLPYNASGGCAVVYNNEIHILGGYKEHYKWNGSTWQEVGELPYKFNNGCAVVYNNEIHILGGVNYRQYHYKWDGSTWTQSASVYVSGGYEGLMAGNAVVYNDAIYVFGGSDGYYTEGAKWNGGDSWEQADTDVHVIGGSAVVYKDKIHILGSSSSGYETQHYTWDGASETVDLEALPYDFEGDQGIVYNDEIHILGGNFNTSHYIINGYLPSYTFKDYIVSDKADAYPNDGEQGGYYYKSVGDIASAFGCQHSEIQTYTPTEDTKVNSSISATFPTTFTTEFLIITSEDVGTASYGNFNIDFAAFRLKKDSQYYYGGGRYISSSTNDYSAFSAEIVTDTSHTINIYSAYKENGTSFARYLYYDAGKTYTFIFLGN